MASYQGKQRSMQNIHMLISVLCRRSMSLLKGAVVTYKSTSNNV